MIRWVRFMLLNLDVGPNQVDDILENELMFLRLELKVLHVKIYTAIA